VVAPGQLVDKWSKSHSLNDAVDADLSGGRRQGHEGFWFA
jgi:hypothetical protein